MIQALFLQAKFAMIEGDLISAEWFLDQAHTTAKKVGLGFWLERVTFEQRYLEDQYNMWRGLIKNNAPFQSRIERAHMTEYIHEAQKIARSS